VIYLHYRMKLSARARQNMKEFWAWLEAREQWFYRVIDNFAAFDDEAAFGAYRAALKNLKADDDWETQRVSQDEWWEFLDTKLTTDPPVNVGFRKT